MQVGSSLLCVVPLLFASSSFGGQVQLPAQNGEPLRFEIELSQQAAREIAALGLEVPVVGRVFVVVTRNGEREPRLQTGATGVPFWGMHVRDYGAADVVTLDAQQSGVIG